MVKICNNSFYPADAIISSTVSTKYKDRCKYKDTSQRNGNVCTAWVIAKGNMDYRRRDIEEEWKEYKGFKD